MAHVDNHMLCRQNGGGYMVWRGEVRRAVLSNQKWASDAPTTATSATGQQHSPPLNTPITSTLTRSPTFSSGKLQSSGRKTREIYFSFTNTLH